MKKLLLHTVPLLAAMLCASGASGAPIVPADAAAEALRAADTVAAAVAADRSAVVAPVGEDAVAVAAADAAALPDTLGSAGSGMRLKRRFLPTSRRFDREINKGKFVYKGEKMLGLTVSYGTLTSEDADMFPVFENINLQGSVMTINPFFGYFYRDNNCFGVRFGYSHLTGQLDTFDVNLGDQNDLDIDIPWLDMSSERFSVALFHRSYVALDEKGRFGLFAELELSFSTGENSFAYKSGEAVKYTDSESMILKAGFNPGVAVYVFPNVCATLSFGLGGFKYTSTKQYDAQGVQIGSRDFSKLNFKLNLADIRIGMNIHLWNKKKGVR